MARDGYEYTTFAPPILIEKYTTGAELPKLIRAYEAAVKKHRTTDLVCVRNASLDRFVFLRRKKALTSPAIPSNFKDGAGSLAQRIVAPRTFWLFLIPVKGVTRGRIVRIFKVIQGGKA